MIFPLLTTIDHLQLFVIRVHGGRLFPCFFIYFDDHKNVSAYGIKREGFPFTYGSFVHARGRRWACACYFWWKQWANNSRFFPFLLIRIRSGYTSITHLNESGCYACTSATRSNVYACTWLDKCQWWMVIIFWTQDSCLQEENNPSLIERKKKLTSRICSVSF